MAFGSSAAGPPSAGEKPPTESLVGRTVGSFKIASLLGEGGMGCVYLAEHTLIGRKAAIKILRHQWATSEGAVDRFMNEARATNVVGHPGIVDVLDVGMLPEGVPYLVMEHLQGESLGQRLARDGKLPIADALAITGETASAVGAAHDKGIIHRDLKPDNLFLVTDAQAARGESVKVLDFGVAKLRGDAAGRVRTLTGALMGTPVYMSPRAVPGRPR